MIIISAGGEFQADTYLVDFIREHAELRGTKYMCKEGGCGTCIVNVKIAHPITNEIVSFSVNSCLVAITSCDNWNITTVEGIGNRKIGYNIIQKRLNHFFGSQCGHCSPGFVMNMYSLVQGSDHHLTEKEIERSFGSNLCRCTGYRPILEAFKSLAVDVNPKLLRKVKDIEDIDQNYCPKFGEKCEGSCRKMESQEWCLVNVKSYDSNLTLPKKISLADGVRPIISYPKVLIDVSNVKELTGHYLDVNLVLGANATLTYTMAVFEQLSKEKDDEFSYLKVLYDHFQQIAHISVRNIGTLAGNLVLKHNYPDFQSDIFLLLDCVGAIVTLVDRKKQETELSMEEFMKTHLTGKVLTNIKLPPLSKAHKLVTYKITPRKENAHAEVNAAFLFKFEFQSYIIQKARFVYGGIAPYFSHCYNTEEFVIGRNIFNNEELQATIRSLKSEIHPLENPPDPSAPFRQKLAISLFYKCILKLCPHYILNPLYESGATTSREDRPPVSQSYQEYDVNKNEFPLTQPLLKKEGMIQCAGEAVYSEDMPAMRNEVFAAFVLSHVADADIESIEKSEALKIDGVLDVFTSEDIPGINNIVRIGFIGLVEKEEILANNKIVYYNQPVAIVVAKTQAIADRASNFVKVNYKRVSKLPPILTIEDAIKAPKQENRVTAYEGITPTDRGINVKKVIKGNFYSPLIYHFTMELHTAVTLPVDEGLEVHTSTQYVDLVQAVIADMLNVPESTITVKNRRCGGGFGCKISRINYVACATALVAHKLNRPCRMAMRLSDIMGAIGKRRSSRLDYEVGVDDKGEIQYLDALLFINNGVTRNESENVLAIGAIRNCYDIRRWSVRNFGVITDMATNCYMRAPGGLEGIGGSEHIMERIAIELKIDPASVRMMNYRKEDNDLPKLVPMFLERVDYDKRQKLIEKFNAHNRWKKRGLKFINMAYPTLYLGNYSALVSVYHGDGSVAVCIGGIEMGQGIYTRIIQVAANELEIPVEKVSVLPTQNFATPNNFATASSITAECCAYSVIRSCREIKKRLEPVRAAMPQATWQEIVFAADAQGINLQANYLTSPNDPRLVNYPIFGIAAVEVEIDVLTGTKWIVRADILEDAGKSINPALDVGQVEGAFIQSLSAWTLEEIKFNKDNGEVLTNRTWNYKIFGAKDIPHDFRIYLRRNTKNPVGILGSKAIGEPPTCLSYVIVESLRAAVQASRLDSGCKQDKYVYLDIPVTNEHVAEAVDVKVEEYLLN
ncbi:unnamed protein product [Diatraea saccharalis]|uniref:Uncharacterized protein n=1 Tax=Diatraea saccharalis TaxID=40085 RepID=A0A9N9RGR2_9NEOP|nr:unnamed protein product [Diatraea saccharalis]